MGPDSNRHWAFILPALLQALAFEPGRVPVPALRPQTLFFRQPEKREVPPAPARHVRAAGGPVRRPHGELDRAVHPQGLRERAVGD